MLTDYEKRVVGADKAIRNNGKQYWQVLSITDIARLIREKAKEIERRENARIDNIKLKERIAALEDALKRLGSMEAFNQSRWIDDTTDRELKARIEYAEQALKETP